MKKRIFSGAQPTGQLHIGNYLGALKNWVALQDEYESFYCIVNLHALTLPQDPATLRQKTLDLARIYLAAGVDPEVSTIFIQSDVAEHTELTWVLSCIARMGELERMTQFKEKSQKVTFKLPNDDQYETIARNFEKELNGKVDKSITREYYIEMGRLLAELSENESNLKNSPLSTLVESYNKVRKENVERAGAGLFNYPVLMAADILLYQTNLVPVGQDQKQHLELTRDLAIRFNRDYGETFTVPEPYIPPAGAKIMSLAEPEKKMSKSDANVAGSIFLLDDADTITKKIKRAVTDSGTEMRFDDSRPAINNLLTIYGLLSGKTNAECEAHFEGKGYGHFKTELAEVVVEFMRPFQEKVHEYDKPRLEKILTEGAEKARGIASGTLQTVYERLGIDWIR